MLPIPDSDLEVLSKVLSWVSKSYSEGLVFCESKRIHLIAPILWSVVQLLPNIKVDVEKDFDGIRVYAHGHFEFIVQAKEEQFGQGAAQCLLGCEVVADLNNIHEVFGIVTNFEKWMRQCMLAMRVMWDNHASGEVYGFVTTGELWRMFKYDGTSCVQTAALLVLFNGMEEEKQEWIDKYSCVVECMLVALANGGRIMKDVVVG